MLDGPHRRHMVPATFFEKNDIAYQQKHVAFRFFSRAKSDGSGPHITKASDVTGWLQLKVQSVVTSASSVHLLSKNNDKVPS